MAPKKAQKCGNTGLPCLDTPMLAQGGMSCASTAHATGTDGQMGVLCWDLAVLICDQKVADHGFQHECGLNTNLNQAQHLQKCTKLL